MNFITKNLGLKILAFLSAITLWFFVVGIENTVYLFPQDIEIQAQNMPANLDLTSALGTAKIRLRLGSDIIKNLNKSDFQISVDLKDLTAGEYTLPLVAHSSNEQVSILKVEPPVVHVKLESVEEKEVPIKISVTGNPQKGYKIKDTQSDQKTAKIRGTRDLLAKITNVEAQVKLDGTQSEDFSQNISLEFPKNIDLQGKNIPILPIQANVHVSIIADVQENNDTTDNSQNVTQELPPGQQEKVVVVQPNLQGGVDLYSFYQTIDIVPLTVMIRGTPETLSGVNLLQTEPIQLSWLREQKQPVQVKLVVPPGVSLVNPKQNTVSIRIRTTTNQ